VDSLVSFLEAFRKRPLEKEKRKREVSAGNFPAFSHVITR